MTSEILKAAAADHTAVLGMTGSGKTSTAKLIVEAAVAEGARVCIIDPVKSDWWGLTSSADGKRPGLPFYILGGPRGHVPLHPTAGAAVGELVATRKLPLSILDLADFDDAGDQHRFFVDFATALFKKIRGVVYLVIEEAHEFAPKERAGFGGETKSMYWAKKLATAGRTKGIRLIVCTQRTQSLHNAILGSCSTMIAHRLGAPADQAPVLQWTKANLRDKEAQKKVEDSLAFLEDGEGWICRSGKSGLTERVQFPRISTYDNTATPTDDSDPTEVKVAPVDQDHLRTIIGDAVKVAEDSDVTVLRRRIDERDVTIGKLRQQMASASTNAPDAVTVEAARQAGHAAGFDEASRQAAKQFTAVKSAVDRARTDLTGLLDVLQLPDTLSFTTPVSPAHPQARAPTHAAPPPEQRAKPSPAASGDGSLTTGAAKLLAVLDTNPPVKRTWVQTATLAGLKARGGHFNTAKKSLLESGLIREDGNLISIIRPTGRPAATKTSAELVEMWCVSLSGAGPKILRALFKLGGRATQVQVAGYLDMQPRGGHWNTGWKELRDNNIATVKGGVAELTELFRP